MTIGVDLRVLSRGSQTGVQQYLINLLPRIFDIGQDQYFKLFYNGFRKKTLDFPWLKFSNVGLQEFNFSNRFLDLASAFFGQPRLDRLVGGAGVYWLPHFLIGRTNCPKVVTFHDLSFEYHPEFFSLKMRLWHKTVSPKRIAGEADYIIAVSDSTKQDLINLYRIEPAKIKVVYSGVGDEFKIRQVTVSELKSIRKKYNLPENFILYFGVLEPRKNLIGLVRAFELFKKADNKFKDYKLVIAGQEGWLFEKIYQAAQKSKFSQDIIFTGFVEEKDKSCLYNMASLFVYPSFFEGFGFPPLEAMACGLPVIVANNTSMPEVVADAGLMINADDPEELAWVMREVLSDEELKSELARRGPERARKFSWEKCAKETREVLLEAAEAGI